LTKLLCIATGGALGSLLRYLVGGWAQSTTSSQFPIGTLTVNALGCLLIGFLMAAFTGPILVREELRLGLVVGVLGGFTTFSAFAYETMRLAAGRQWAFVAANLTVSNAVGLLGVWIGARAAQKWFGV